MRLGYMTNGFGPLVGEGGGVTSVKDIRYLTMGDDEEILKKITETGFRCIEVLEGKGNVHMASAMRVRSAPCASRTREYPEPCGIWRRCAARWSP